MPNSDEIPAGLRLELKPNGLIAQSDLPPLLNAPRTSVDENVTQWRDDVPTIPARSKGKKRARDEDIEDEAEVSSRNHPRRTTPKGIPAPVRRSERLKTGNKINTVSAKGKTKVLEKGDHGAGGSKYRAHLRTPAKRV